MYEDAVYILNKLKENNFDAYIVGGYPRDKYLGIESNDFDICTSAKPEETAKIFKTTDLSHKKFGRVDIYLKSNIYQVTTFRKDICYDEKRMPTICYVSNLLDDLKRRDFIINTLAIDSNGNYVDLLGAIEDLDNKVIKTVKNSHESIIEDPLRILRAIRFSIKLSFDINEDLSNQMSKHAKLVNNISSNKVREEINKIIAIDDKMASDMLQKYNLSETLDL